MFKAVAVASTLAFTNAVHIENDQEATSGPSQGPKCAPNLQKIASNFFEKFDKD